MKNGSFRIIRRSKDRKKNKVLEERYQQKLEETVGNTEIHENLDQNLEYVKKVLGESYDLITRKLIIDQTDDRYAGIVYLDDMVNKDLVHQFIIRPLVSIGESKDAMDDLWKAAVDKIVEAGETKPADGMKSVIDAILSGDTILFIDGYKNALIMGSKGWYNSLREPRSEHLVRGSREGFTETLSFNIGMIRHRLKDPDLRIKMLSLGKRTKTVVNLLYIEGVADPKIVNEVEQRIKRIEIDGVLESGYIEEFIQDQIWSPFPQLQNTERPDAVVSHLLEGKVAVLTDGTPHALIAPAVFTQFYYSPEDYYERYLIATFLRLIRLISLFAALLLPALYIAFSSFHPEMIPSKFALAMASGRSTVPFPSIVEALMMEFSVEVLREASIRLPGPIGPTIGIVGALVIGEASVSAGLVSPAMVIVVAITTISSYANPSYNAAISVRLLRFPLMIAATVFGLYGIMIGVMLILLHLVELRSFGVPYVAPYSPFQGQDSKDSLFRAPWQWMNKRPVIFRPQNERRQPDMEREKREDQR
ncbi:spore germination protein [Lihuaxuella thermophila]|uniref:Spore germination protein n=1 Tax=Lihuaxuella thermophila TaxID=1173111 RepID=A0A1H8E9C4_9BACL|nr:spore germination protein [Lihuaxuella thermophila]SEN16062.1 spore germination protein [Lihuaxuella thermophila]